MDCNVASLLIKKNLSLVVAAHVSNGSIDISISVFEFLLAPSVSLTV